MFVNFNHFSFPLQIFRKRALNSAEDIALLALHEAIVFSLEGLLTELGEHGLLNGALLGIESDQIHLRNG